MLPRTAQLLRSRLKGSTSKVTESRGASFGPVGVRTYFVDAPDKEAREEDSSDGHVCSPSTTDAPSSTGRGGHRAAPGAQALPAEAGQGPVRVSQPPRTTSNNIGRRKVLGPGKDTDFTGNVATLLVRWPRATSAKPLPRSWREVVDNDRFQHIFPRRPSALSDGAIQGLKALAASEALESSRSSSSSSSGQEGLDPGGARFDPRQAAITELMERLQAVQQHLQNNLPDDGNGDNATIVAFAAFSEDNGEDSSGDDNSACSTSGDYSEDDEDDEGLFEERRGYRRYGSNGGDTARRHGMQAGSGHGGGDAEGAGGGGGGGTRGRRLRLPFSRKEGRRPTDPLWDDTLPFQTQDGTVFHFWRLCPYG